MSPLINASVRRSYEGFNGAGEREFSERGRIALRDVARRHAEARADRLRDRTRGLALEIGSLGIG